MMRRTLGLVLLGAVAACGSDATKASRDEVLAITGGNPERGEAAIGKYGCGSCHVIPGARQARGRVGPPLSDFAERAFIAGRSPNTPSHLAAWIRRPDSVEPGTAMPSLGVSEAEARDIAAYLYLETGSDLLGPPRLLPGSVLKPE
jgi:cytochrome c